MDAIKVIRPDRLARVASDTIRQMQYRFEQESLLAARVAHEHIVPVYQVGEVDGCPWFSMQYVEGATLHALSHGCPMVPERVAKYLECIARAVDAVHRHGILHGDIKPHNILIERETDRPLISDFGLAEFDACDVHDASLGVAGTPAYMAPELAIAALQNNSLRQAAAMRSVSTDIYSLGATLWAALSGHSLCHENRSPQQQLADVASMNLRVVGEMPDNVPAALLRICRKCLVEDPAARYASAREFADDLAAWLNRPRWNRHFPRLRHLLWMIVAPSLLTSSAAVWLQMRLSHSEPWVWLTILIGYVPLFVTFLASQQDRRSSGAACRELWSIWIGHLAGSLACLISLRVMCHPDFARTIAIFYPCWAAVSSVAFFAKSGNFWTVYRWIGLTWSATAVLLALTPNFSPVIFGVIAALTCVLIARGDSAFADE